MLIAAFMLMLTACSKTEPLGAPDSQTQRSQINKVSGKIGFACPSQPGMVVALNYDGAPYEDDANSWLTGDIPVGSFWTVPDISVPRIYFSLAAPSRPMNFTVEGPMEIIEHNGYFGYLRYKYKYDANGRITDMNGNYPDANTFSVLITAY